MKNVISVDRILDNIRLDSELNLQEGLRHETPERIAENKKLLHSLLISKLPEKVKLDNAVYLNKGDGYREGRIGYKIGFNECLEYMRKSIDEMFEVKG